MYLPIQEWSDSLSVQDGPKIIYSLKCVNDCAEPGVKLGADFLAAAKTEKRYQNILQVVENHCKVLPNQRKIKLTHHKCWILTLTN